MTLFFILAGCNTLEEASEENGADASLSAGIAALSGVAHSVSTSTGIFNRDPLRTVTACDSPPAADACSSNQRRATYTSCLTAQTEHTYSGSILLSYSATGCTLSSNGDFVTRTIDFKRILGFVDFPRFNDTTLATTTESHEDYLGNTIGGGTRLTYVGSSPTSFEIEMAGLHKILTNTGEKVLYDVSIHSVSPMTLTGDVSGDRILDGGSIQVAHNRAFYTADLTPISLHFNSKTCCHPVGGTVGVTFGGKAVGTAQVVFTTTCGIATLKRDGVDSDISLHGCE